VVAPGSSDTGSGPDVSGEPAGQPATGAARLDVTGRRRLAALAGHTGDRTSARRALTDSDPSVRTTALGALRRLGDLSDADLATAIADPAPAVRRRAIELAADRPEVEVGHALADRDASVVEMAAWALGEQGSSAAVPALVALAAVDGGHSDPLCREAAVAALGAIGDPDGLAAVLGALDDKPANRRRAAAALAAFEGPEVDAALQRCLDDRDWQVRQVAEDLLADG